MEHLGAVRAPHFLDHVRAHDHSARAAFLVAHFGERHSIMFLDDAIVMIEQVFGNFRDGARALGVQIGQVLFGHGAIRFHR